VIFYATGGGQTNPAGVDGSPAAAPYPSPVEPVSVTIGGTKAAVAYAGAAPGFIAGLLQINVQIPTGLLSTAPLILTIGSASSQPASTITIK
jgi:uncharacterized protein (TIGR03437 family)